MKLKNYLLSLFLLLTALGSATAQIQFNELFINPPGTDNGFEFIELSGPPNTSLNGVWFLVIEGDAANAGIIDQAIDLSGNTIGANGLFLHRDAATILIPPPSPQTNVFVQDFAPDIENGSNTFLLVSGFTGAVGQDLDAANDGTLDAQPWGTVYDGISNALLTGTFAVYADDLGLPVFPGMSFTIEAYILYNNQWIASNITGAGVNGPFLFDTLQTRFIDTSALDITTICPAYMTPGVSNPTLSNLQATATATPACGGGTNGTINLTVTGGVAPYVYQWSNGDTNQDPTGLAPGTYQVSVGSANGCATTASATVGTSPAPTVAVTGTLSVCPGASTVLTAAGAATYLWSTGATTAAITVSPMMQTTFTVTGTNAAGCTALSSVTVTVNAAPSVTINNPAAACAGAAVNLVATVVGIANFTWTTGATTASITVNPTNTTTYGVTATGQNGCTASAGRTVTVLASPTPTITGATAICLGASSTLTAAGGNTYSWNTGAISATISISPAVTTTYTVTATNTGTGCTASVSQVVTVTNNPVATITGNTTLCNGASTQLTASGANSYIWSNAATTQTITVSPNANQSYSVTVTYPGNCTATATAAVTVNPNPLVAITGTTTICNGANTTLTATGGGTYSWSNGGTSASITVAPNATTAYTVTVTTANGCTGTSSASVTVNPSPTATISGPTAICANESATLNASGGGTYNWSNGETTASISVSPLNTTAYTVTVTNAGGCTDSETLNLTVFALPAPIPTQNGNVLNAGGTFASYQWLLNGAPINGATGQSYTVTQNGNYTVEVTDANGCANISDPINITNIGLVSLADNVLRAYPNPTNGLFVIELDQTVSGLVQVFDLQGRLAVSAQLNNTTTVQLDLSTFSNGLYLVRLVTDGQVLGTQVVLNK